MVVKRFSHFFAAFVVFIVALTLLGIGYSFYFKANVDVSRNQYLALATHQVSSIDNAVSKILGRTDSVRELILDHKGETDFFEERVPSIHKVVRETTGVDLLNIAVAPKGIVEKIYPLAGNEALLNFNFMDASLPGNASAVQALQDKKMILTNPFNLKQGGVGMGARTPVYLDQDKTELWGLYTVTFRFSSLLDLIGLEKLSSEGINWSLYYRKADGQTVSLAKSDDPVDNPVTVDVRIQNLTWTLAISPAQGWYSPREVIVNGLIALIMALLAGALALYYQELRASRDVLRHLAERDGLTRCYSRHYLNTILIDPASGYWTDPNAQYSLAIIDIDHFKDVNDRYGHETGDRAILAVANTLQKSVRKGTKDCVIRFGGDEFVILLDNLSETDFRSRLEEILSNVRAIRFPDIADFRLTLSVGAECFTSPVESSYYELLRRADEKLYSVKKSGRNAVKL